jgi:transcriptional regulator with XRE-family HTH domain
MSFSIKLQTHRLERNLSQEALAEILNVSRQAVAKWENNQSLPDIENLIKLSDYFQTSIDRLVREDSDTCHIIDSSSIEKSWDEETIDFLIRGKRATYSSGGGEVTSSRLASHDLSYEEDNLLYYDTYLGGEKFTGEEAIWKDHQPVWSMNYSGRVIGEGFSGDFLKEALFQVPEDKPFRGPDIYTKGDFIYHCQSQGNFEWYQGYESIYLRGEKIYECVFHGGLVK